jgi:hypothetical protein
MRIKLFSLLLVLILNSTIVTMAQVTQSITPAPHDTNVFGEKDGYLSVEAEDFYKQSQSEVRQWYRTTEGYAPAVGRDEDGNHSSTASGKTYIEILPDTRVTHADTLIHGENFSNEPGEMAIVHYKIKINNPGRYYVWVRAFSTGTEDNGVHVGLNGKWPEHGQRIQWCDGKNQWTWSNSQRTKEVHCGVPHEIYLDIAKSGEREIQFSMREDGFEFDQFILTKDADYIPQEDPEIQPDSAAVADKKPSWTINPPSGRLAVVADGNSPDPDDLGGTAVSIALLRAAGLEDRLVHYSHSCDLERVERISAAAERERHALMQSACEVTARRWGGFEGLRFYDAKWQQDETVQDLSKAIDTSSASDPL